MYHLDDGKVALKTCHDRHVTAPMIGSTRPDWKLWQESELGECGKFILYDLGGDKVAFETCANHMLTAGDGGWPEGLAWAVVGETDDILDWERFAVLQPFTPPQSMIANFDGCRGITRLGGKMGATYDRHSSNRLIESYVQEGKHGCVVKLEYEIVTWAGFWIQLQGIDLSRYGELVFDIRADQRDVPEKVKVELKRAGIQEISIQYYNLAGITTSWQTISVNLIDFEGSLSSFRDMEELVFTFETTEEEKIGVVYLDSIALQ
jgi:hypothetical protein